MNLKFIGSIYFVLLRNSVMVPKVNQFNLNEAFNRRNYIMDRRKEKGVINQVKLSSLKWKEFYPYPVGGTLFQYG
jgi:hypothetical protein